MQVQLVDLRQVRWGKSYLWDLYFPPGPAYDGSFPSPPDPPKEFQEWFPAYAVQEPIFQIATQPITLPHVEFQIPKSVSYGELQISFYDDVFEHLREWLWEWCMWMFSTSITPPGGDVPVTDVIPQGGVATRTLAECIRPVVVERYDEKKISPIRRREYFVFPSNSLLANLNSESGLMDYTATFVVVSGMFTRNQIDPTAAI